ncbi:MAG TPA: hypothetical protein VFZ35_04630, partial [Sphingomicrobium sp.]
MRVAILCNGYDLALWQRRAIDRIAPDHTLYVLAVGEQPPPPRRPRHWAYYALNLFTIRNRQTARVPFPDAAVAIVDRLDAQPEFDGHWAVLTPDMVEWLKANRIDAIVKFGLGLLRVPDESVLPIPILSYHHGNPENFRGRPAGFHELANGEPFVGQVVQILTNRLDAGRIVASSESRSVAHSYRQTLVGLYSLSPYLLPDALRAVARGDSRAVAPGRNFRLPGTLAVIRFLLQRWRALLERLAYGAFVEKKWKVGWCGMSPSADPLSAVRDAEAQPWQVPRIASPYSFYADPFFEPDGESIVVEAMNGWSGKGEIVRLRPGSAEPLRGLNGHASYPICVEDAGQAYIVPEISDWSPATLFRREAGELIRMG